MSLATSTATAPGSELRPLAGTLWRVVEAQHKVSTLALVDSAAEQALLEDILETGKPRYPQGAGHLHYLLKSPFRYEAPYPRGSRFRRAGASPGVFYAAERLPTALAETAWWRLRFHAAAPQAPVPDRPVLHTAFQVRYGSCEGVDLTRPPLVRDRSLWMHPEDYAPTQALAGEARQALACAIRYASVRDEAHRACVALLTPSAFAASSPLASQTWASMLRAAEVQCWRPSGDERLVLDVRDLRGG